MTTLAYSSMRNEEFENEEFLARKTDEKNEVNLKMVFEKQNLAYLEENFLNSENLVKNCQIRMQ